MFGLSTGLAKSQLAKTKFGASTKSYYHHDFVKLTTISNKQQVIFRKQESANTSNTPQSQTKTLNQLKSSNSKDIQIIKKTYNRKKHIQTP